MKKILVLLFCSLVLVLTACGGPEKKTEKPAEPQKKAEPAKTADGKQILNLFSWADNFDPEVLADFETARLIMTYSPTMKNSWPRFRPAAHVTT